MKKILEESQKAYVDIQSEIQKIRDKIRQREDQILRLKNKQEKLYDKSFWGELLVRPIMEAVKEKFPELEWADENLVPMGLCSRISVFTHFNDKTVMLAFTPTDLNNGIISLDTGEKEKGYPKNSIGELNGFGRICEPITDIQQVFDNIQKQLDE